MKDYSNHKSQYGIIESGNNYAIVEVKERSVDDESEIIEHKPDTLSLSRHVATLQRQINDMLTRESTPVVSGFEAWENERDRRARYKAKKREKVEVK